MGNIESCEFEEKLPEEDIETLKFIVDHMRSVCTAKDAVIAQYRKLIEENRCISYSRMQYHNEHKIDLLQIQIDDLVKQLEKKDEKNGRRARKTSSIRSDEI